MTKKHFIALAEVIKTHNANDSVYGQFNPTVIDVLADFCASTNPRFNREQWIAYINGECGKNGGKVKQSTVKA